jgi:hypothetical protein
LIACAAMWLSGPAAADDMPPNDPHLNGKWDGVLTSQSNSGEAKTLGIRLTLDEGQAKVEYQKENGVWQETMPGSFVVSRQGGNAVIAGTDSGKYQGDRWVETWVFGVTCQSDSALRVAYVRLVNNVTVAPSDPEKTFSALYSGTMGRMTAAMLAAEANSPIVQITAEASGRYNFRDKSLSADELKVALIAEKKMHPVTGARLLEGNAHPSWEHVMDYAMTVFDALGLKEASYERDDEFKIIVDSRTKKK